MNARDWLDDEQRDSLDEVAADLAVGRGVSFEQAREIVQRQIDDYERFMTCSRCGQYGDGCNCPEPETPCSVCGSYGHFTHNHGRHSCG